MSLIYALIIGGLAGWITGKLMKGEGFGLVGNIVIGLIGGLLGGFVFRLLDFTPGGGIIGQLITAVAGAALLVWLLGMVKK